MKSPERGRIVPLRFRQELQGPDHSQRRGERVCAAAAGPLQEPGAVCVAGPHQGHLWWVMGTRAKRAEPFIELQLKSQCNGTRYANHKKLFCDLLPLPTGD